jgi:predicted dehydrogenase
MSEHGELVAVASRDIDRAKSYASEWEIPHALGGYQEMLSSDLVDAVYVSLPNDMHADWSIKAMECGKHVLCEKPLALTVADVDRMIQTSHRTNRVLAEAFMYLHHPQMHALRSFLESRRLGDILVVSADFHFTLTNRPNIRLQPERGGGSLWDVGTYPISFARFALGGTPEEVSGMQVIGDTGVDEVFVGQMRFENGSLAHVTSGFRGADMKAHILGTKGRIVMNRPYNGDLDTSRLVFHPNSGDPKELAFEHEHRYLGEVTDMHAAILDGREGWLPLEQTRDHIRIATALYESAGTRTPIAL